MALQKLRRGEIDALIRVIGKPIDFFAKITAKDDMHLVPIPFSKNFSDYYALSEFTKAEYPNLISEGETTSTLGVPAVLAVYNWPRQSDRARRVQRMTERMFANWEKFQSPPRHPKWKEVNLAATVPGWTRWAPAEEICRRCARNRRRLPTQDRGRSQVASRRPQISMRQSASGCTGNSSSGKRTRNARLGPGREGAVGTHLKPALSW